ncbi:hypothetical protein CAP35_08780 [Chitinophagaceae bacterium IBVUCB1]|nr:hypothetical protein CAP35_08780 [Chitinophagaceae bacterium IBVUCB1]
MRKSNIVKLAFVMACLLAGANETYAQQTASATATASATIITPIAISKTADMNFGNIAVSSSSAGTVVLAPAGTRTTTGGVTLPATTGSPAAAAFTVTGQGSYTYAITLPSSATLSDGGSNTMTVNTFTSNPSSTGTLSSGTQNITVGATLNVSAGQATGSYTTSSPFTVTVNYN